ncbi:MAG: efflux RND transporter permease subunit, partial [Terriglobales bacterium]
FSDRHGPLEITDYADRYIADTLKTLPGVASVIIGGERRYAMRLWIDRDRLAGYGLTAQDIESALRRQNVELPSGRIESREREFTVLAESDLRTVEQFNEMIITEARGYPVRLKDIGRAELGAQDDRNALRVNGKPTVGLGVVKQSTANTLEVARAVKKVLPRIEQGLPPGMEIYIAFDSSVFIEASITAVYETLAAALLLVVLVIYLFLRSLRATLIPFVTIPVSLIGAFFFLWLMGFSVNVLTLLGLVLAIGLVVDDAIVVLENIYRHRQMGKPRFTAAFDGAREVWGAVLASTLTTIAVFVPVLFIQQEAGQLFGDIALALSCAVGLSLIVSITVIPSMAAKMLHVAEHDSKRRGAHNLWGLVPQAQGLT